MLENLDLGRKLSKQEYKEKMPELQYDLHRLQRALWQARVATIIVFEGWDVAGKGTAISKLTQRLEPRGFELFAIRAPRSYNKPMPWLWRFWRRLPSYGKIGIFDHSWYGKVLVERVEGLTPEEDLPLIYSNINSFERALADDRYIFVKFFLHISKKEQAKRFKKLESDPLTAWQVEKHDWKHHDQYEQYLTAAEEMLAQTETEWAPWSIVEATDKRWVRVKVFESVIRRLRLGLQTHGYGLPDESGREDSRLGLEEDDKYLEG
jgi:polyphosphate kinase 2 (PPK2 family)